MSAGLALQTPPQQRPRERQYLYSPAVQTVATVSFANAPYLTWDAFVRQSYNGVNEALDKQALLLLRRGNITQAEANALVTARNQLVMQMRQKLSPFGRLYSEILKPARSLPTLETLLAKKGSVEGVLRSVGRSRAVVNRVSFALRGAGPALIVLQVVVSAVVIAEAPPEQRGRVAAGEIGSVGGAALFGAGGGWAGCAGAALVVSPSLAIPIVGEITEGGACLIGALGGGALFGWLGSKVGRAAGTTTYDFISDFRWTSGQ